MDNVIVLERPREKPGCVFDPFNFCFGDFCKCLKRWCKSKQRESERSVFPADGRRGVNLVPNLNLVARNPVTKRGYLIDREQDFVEVKNKERDVVFFRRNVGFGAINGNGHAKKWLFEFPEEMKMFFPRPVFYVEKMFQRNRVIISEIRPKSLKFGCSTLWSILSCAQVV